MNFNVNSQKIFFLEVSLALFMSKYISSGILLILTISLNEVRVICIDKAEGARDEETYAKYAILQYYKRYG